MQATGDQEARARQRALNFRKRFGCLGQARGLAAKAAWKARGCMGQNVSFHFSSGVQSTLFGVVSQARQGAKSQSHLHTYLPMLLWHWCTHVRTCQYRFGHCARTYSCTEIGTRSVCCTIIAFFPHIPAGIQGTVSERQLSLQEQYIDNFISSYIVLNVPEWPREWIS